mgnify:CR=1 FL=1
MLRSTMSPFFWMVWVAYTLIVIVFIFAFCVAEPEDEGWNGRVTRALFYDLPESVENGCRWLLPGRVFSCMGNSWDWVCNQKNPLLQLGYLGILNGAYVTFLIHGAHRFEENIYITNVHNYIAFAGIVMCHVFFYKACMTHPGRITQENYPCFMHTEYDGTLYVPGKACSTCKLPKPARSKHCSMCGICVPISDHHCVWLNQCVGELNYKWFLSFLVYHILFFGYCTFVLFTFMYSRAVVLKTQRFTDLRTMRSFMPTTWMVILHLCKEETGLMVVTCLAFVMCVAIGAFFTYHMWLVKNGMTTSENVKWTYTHKMYDRLLEAYNKAKSRLDADKESNEDNRERKDARARADADPDDDADTSAVGSSKDDLIMEAPEAMAGCVGITGVSTSTTKLVLDQINGGKTFADITRDLKHPGERPRHIYDRGFWENLMRIWYPPSLEPINLAKRGTGVKIEKAD